MSADEATPAGALRRLRGARKQNARGVSLAYAPHSYRLVSASASVLLIGWRFFRMYACNFVIGVLCQIPGIHWLRDSSAPQVYWYVLSLIFYF